MKQILQSMIGYLIGYLISLVLARMLADTKWGRLPYTALAEEIVAKFEDAAKITPLP